jgi:hypothetical protein
LIQIENKKLNKTVYKAYLKQTMRKLPAPLLMLVLLVGAPVLVHAQESNSRQYGTLEGQNENRYYESNAEGDPNTFRAALKADSTARHQLKKVTVDNHKQASKKTEDDAIPFNFLYYIIQRFKTSDLIED